MSIPSLLCALLFTSLAPTGEPADGTPPGAIHLGSYSSQLGARLGADGTLDTGAVVARLVDLDAGTPLAPRNQHMGIGHNLVQLWAVEGEGFGGEVSVGAGSSSSLGDTRLTVGIRVLVTNPGEQPEELRLALELSAGSLPGEARPLPAMPFEQGERWSVDGEFLLRGGRTVAIARAPTARLELLGLPVSGDSPAARLVWHLELPPGGSRIVEATLAGAPTTDQVDEEAFRSMLRRRTHDMITEELGWQAKYNGAFGRFQCADERVRDCMVAAIGTLRTLGVANNRVRSLSDRPYGHPASDGAFEPQALGALYEHRMADISGEFLAQLLGEARQRMAALDPDRQLVFLHGLARCVRLQAMGEDAPALAVLIEEFLSQDHADGTLAVDPWLDPDVVRADLVAVLRQSGRGGEDALPSFAWAEVEPGSTEATFQAWRRALSARDGIAAWTALSSLLDDTTRRGFGGMVPGGDVDGRWALGMATLFRAMLIDDHAEELHLLPGAAYGLIDVHHDVESDFYPTRFGMLKVQEFHSSPRLLGGWLVMNEPRWPERIVMVFPPDAQLRKLKGTPEGGLVTLLDDRSAEIVVAPDATRGLRFLVRRGPWPGDDTDVDSGDDG